MKIVIGENKLLKMSLWLINLRWVAAVILIGVITIVQFSFNISIQEIPLYYCVLILLAYNLVLHIVANRNRNSDNFKPETIKQIIKLQISADFILLTVMLHYSGGVENPFIIYYIFHMIISSIVLTKIESYFQTSFALFCVGALSFLEYFAIVPHYNLEGFLVTNTYNNLMYILGTGGIFVTTSVFVVYIATSIVSYQRLHEEAHKIANEKLIQKNKEIEVQQKTLQNQASELECKNMELKKLSIVASNTDSSVLIMDSEQELTWVNNGFTKVLGYTLEEFTNLFGSNLNNFSSNPKIKNAVQQAISERKSIEYIAKTETKSGIDVWLHSTLTPIFEENGKLCKIIAIDVDITHIKLQEEYIKKQKLIIEKEKEKSDNLLLNILPKSIADDLKRTGKTVPEVFENVTVLFSDLVGFTKKSSDLEPNFLINELNDIFTVFDNISEKNNCERIKTIGDAYLMVSGMPKEDPKHAENAVKSALEIIKYLNDRNKVSEYKWEIRVGIHTGKVVGGVVGIKKYIYDVFGDTINTASRMESTSEPMRINVSEVTYNLVKDKFNFIERNLINVKGKGSMKMHFVDNSSAKSLN
ncbi:MAG: PAS domain-containing protein [Bacteroidales bacterium]|nr:PAS domain-containing protein [Bacteroidales bacterium]